jgi:hypothetical protein
MPGLSGHSQKVKTKDYPYNSANDIHRRYKGTSHKNVNFRTNTPMKAMQLTLFAWIALFSNCNNRNKLDIRNFPVRTSENETKGVSTPSQRGEELGKGTPTQGTPSPTQGASSTPDPRNSVSGSPYFNGDLGVLRNPCEPRINAKILSKEFPTGHNRDWAALAAYTLFLTFEDYRSQAENDLNILSFTKVKFFKKDSKDLIVLMAVQPRFNLLAIRSTREAQNWATDLLSSTTPANWPGGPGWVHGPFLDILNSIYDDLLSDFRALGYNQQLPTLLAGYDVGGAVAALVATKLKVESKGPIQLMTFGQPRVGDVAFAGHLKTTFSNQYVRYADDDDVFPLIPPPSSMASHLPVDMKAISDLITLRSMAHAGTIVRMKDKKITAISGDYREEDDIPFWQRNRNLDLRKLNLGKTSPNGITHYLCSNLNSL